MELKNGERLFCWPMIRHVITAGWTYNSNTAHGAIDLRAAVGTPVYAAEAGVVDWVQHWNGWQKTGNQSYGTLVRIRHEDYRGRPLYSLYAHLSAVRVKEGQRVTEGQEIGLSGESGNCFGAHLHFEVQYGGTGSVYRVNPLNWLDGDFTCANEDVKAHLGRYTSVVRPVDENRTAEEDKPSPDDSTTNTAFEIGLVVQKMSRGDMAAVRAMLDSLDLKYMEVS